MNREPQRPADFDPKLWDLLGRHQSVAPSVGFADRTVRRLREPPAQPRWTWRWAWAGAAAVALVIAVGLHWHAPEARQAELFATATQAEYLEDYDVIASLHLLEDNSL